MKKPYGVFCLTEQVVMLAIPIPLSYPSYRYIEEPFIGLSYRRWLKNLRD